jgi:DNA-binding HxlR family transcriptional regulator
MKKGKKAGNDRRSDCPISCTLDLVGDKWSLLIIRDMLFFGKSSFNEFLDSSEKIATNILRDRLQKLTELGLIKYTGLEKRKKYTLTKTGLALKPVLEAIGNFGMAHFKGSREHVAKRLKVRGK